MITPINLDPVLVTNVGSVLAAHVESILMVNFFKGIYTSLHERFTSKEKCFLN